ncbi:MAG: phosphotransferase [Defluviitaleaceae bacterium]|nr:phosphotransferase [Defluviitaleaceae bacterium]
MINRDYNLSFDKLCEMCGLGDLVEEPKPLVGGYLNKMFAMQATLGKYAVKAINPNVIIRPTAMRNYINSELIATAAAKAVPVCVAKIIDGKVMQEVCGQYYLVFDWMDGVCLKDDEISELHCGVIGQILADIHLIDFDNASLRDDDSADESLIDFVVYLQMGREKGMPWVEILEQNMESLQGFDAEAIRASKVLAENMVASHRDLDPKNVLWNGDSPTLVDWEAAGLINPHHDLLETALYWAVDVDGGICKDKFDAFMRGYQSKIALGDVDWSAVFAMGYSAKLGWLEYSLKRSLGIEAADGAEVDVGTRHVMGTVRGVLRYSDMVKVVEGWLEDYGWQN